VVFSNSFNGRQFRGSFTTQEHTMDSDKQDSNFNDQQGRRPKEEEKKKGSHGQIGNLQDPAEDQTSDAQLNQGQGDQSNQGSHTELSQPHEQSHDDLFSEEASNEAQRRDSAVESGQSDRKI
jgi:hypothetical protein